MDIEVYKSEKQRKKEYQKKYRQENAAKISEQKKKYYKENSDYYKKYRQENAAEIKEKNKKYRQENADYYKKYHRENTEYKEYQKKYRQENAAKISEQNKRYNHENADYYKKYHRENAEKANKRSKNWRQENPEYQKEWRKENPAKVIVLMQRRRAKKQMLKSTLTIEQWNYCKNEFDNKCCYCGKEKKLTQDHFIPIDKNGEYTSNNILPSCRNCNSSKNSSSFLEWYPKQSYYSEIRKQKIIGYIEKITRQTN